MLLSAHGLLRARFAALLFGLPGSDLQYPVSCSLSWFGPRVVFCLVSCLVFWFVFWFVGICFRHGDSSQCLVFWLFFWFIGLVFRHSDSSQCLVFWFGFWFASLVFRLG
jgi:hypothetical protein